MREAWRTAAVEGNCDGIRRLLADGIDIESLDRFGQTALMLAALHGRDAAVQILVENGADLNVTAKYNLSALMLAVINHHVAVARKLVDAGADTEIRGSGPPGFFEKTAQDLAEQADLDDLAAYIAQSRK